MVRKMKKIIVSMALVMLMLVFYAGAVNFEYSYLAKTDSIYTNETAYYSMKIINNNDYDDRYQLYTLSAFWDISPTLVNIAKLSTETFSLEIMPIDTRLVGPQLVPVTIKSLKTEDLTVENFYVYIKQTNETPKQYIPNVATEVKIAEEIDARKPVSLEVYMRNRNPLDLKDVTIAISSKLFNKEYQSVLGPLEEKTNQILFADLNPMQPPGTYDVVVRITAFDGNVSLGEIKKQVRILGYSDVSIEQTKTTGLFTVKEKIVLYNDGNYEVDKLFKLEKNFFERVFTTSSAKPVKMVDNGIAYLSWNVPLEPKQQYIITVTTNYTILALIIIVIIIAIISYYIFRSPVLIFKKAKITSSSEEGVSDIKVKLHIKNRSGKIIRNIKIVDKYPKIVQLEEESGLGTLKPTKMLSADKTHQLLMWNLETLDPYEERLIVYRLRSTLNIVGNVSLPASKIKFHTATGERTYYSNGVKLLHKSHHSIKTD